LSGINNNPRRFVNVVTVLTIPGKLPFLSLLCNESSSKPGEKAGNQVKFEMAASLWPERGFVDSTERAEVAEIAFQDRRFQPLTHSPVTLIETDRQRYLVAPYGEVSWVGEHR
jgi:hypothetical protein